MPVPELTFHVSCYTAGNSEDRHLLYRHKLDKLDNRKMTKAEQQERFIELRAEGLSYDKLAAELGISKPTALKLGHDFEQEVKRLQFVHLEAMAEQYKLVKTARIEGLAKLLEQVDTALQSADFGKMAPDRLVLLKLKLQDRLLQELVIRCNVYTSMCAPTDSEDSGRPILKVD